MSDLSIATYAASGAASVQYAVPFPFIDRSHVRVLTAYDKGAGAFDTELAAGSGFLWINDSTIEIPALAGGTVFSIVRQTPSDLPLVDWVAGGGALTANELTTSTLQALYLAQERFDQASATSAQAGAADAASAAAAADAESALTIAENLQGAVLDGVIPDGSIGTDKLAGGAVTAAKTDAGVQASLGRADSAVQPAGLALYAPLDSPDLTGIPTAPTPISIDDSTRVATTTFVKNQGYAKATDLLVDAGLVNAYGICRYVSFTPIGLNNTVAGSQLRLTRFTSDGTAAGADTATPLGTWRNLGTEVGLNEYGLFQRIF